MREEDRPVGNGDYSDRNPIAKLRAIADILCQGETPPPVLANWLGSAIQAFLSRQHGSLEDVLGLRYGRGGVPWWMEEAIRTRDAALRDLAGHLVPQGAVYARAQAVHKHCQRYAGCAWRLDRTRAEMPARYLGTDRELLWRAFAAGAAMPLGERRLRQILGDQPNSQEVPRSPVTVAYKCRASTAHQSNPASPNRSTSRLCCVGPA